MPRPCAAAPVAATAPRGGESVRVRGIEPGPNQAELRSRARRAQIQTHRTAALRRCRCVGVAVTHPSQRRLGLSRGRTGSASIPGANQSITSPRRVGTRFAVRKKRLDWSAARGFTKTSPRAFACGHARLKEQRQQARRGNTSSARGSECTDSLGQDCFSSHRTVTLLDQTSASDRTLPGALKQPGM